MRVQTNGGQDKLLLRLCGTGIDANCNDFRGLLKSIYCIFLTMLIILCYCNASTTITG